MRYRVAIASLTRQRPDMFAELLMSLVGLNWPDNVDPAFIFVENDCQLSIEDHVEKFMNEQRFAEVYLANEPRPGIPAARNRVLDIALSSNADFLAFVDDDELVSPDWIAKILSKAIDNDLDLVGGPLELIRSEVALNRRQKLCWDFLQKKNAKRIRAANELVSAGREGEVRIFTNNWLVRMDFVRRFGLRFDESMGHSGGTDTKFYVRCRKLGAKTGWAKNAVVKDQIPLARLSPLYQFKRARDQNMALYFIDGHDERRFSRVRVVVSLVRRVFRGTIKILFSAFKGGRGFIDALTSIGAGLGFFYAAFGKRSTHYKIVVEDKK